MRNRRFRVPSAQNASGSSSAAGMWRTVIAVALGSRVLVLIAGIIGEQQVPAFPGYQINDPTGITAPYGYLGNLLSGPFVRWDSYWYLTIAAHGYGPRVDLERRAFFPLFPLLIHVVGWLTGDIPAGIVISLIGSVLGLAAVFCLAEMDFGSRVARVAVTLIGLSPFAVFLSAIYTESLFLALSAGCLLMARRGRWMWAGVLGGLAALTHDTGVLLAVPMLIIALSGSASARRPAQLARAVLPVALVPAGLAAFIVWNAASIGRPWASLEAQSLFHHHLRGPVAGIADGASAAWDGVRQIFDGGSGRVFYSTVPEGAALNGDLQVIWFLSLLAGVIACLGVLRRQSVAMFAYVALAILVPVSDPVSWGPLCSLNRFELVLFPLFIWAADVLVRRGWTIVGVAASASLLGVFSLLFTTWRFIG